MNLLIDSALKATVILFAAWAASLALRRASAGVRHTVWLAAMLAVAALPALLSIPQAAFPSAAILAVSAMPAGPQIAARRLPWLSMFWALGASLVLLRLMLGTLAASRITRSAQKSGDVLYSDRASTPMTWGFFRPEIVLPSYALDWNDAERDLVIRHEQAHIARHDWLWQTLATVITAAFWFHPMVWLAALELRREAEGAVDDQLLSNGVAPSDYASRLLDVARRGISAPAAVIAMVRKPELESRVRAILDSTRRRKGAGMFVRCAIVAAAVTLVLPIAITRPVYAQGKVYRMSDGVSQPTVLYKQEPEYTQEAKDAKIEGTVVLQVEITPEGSAQNFRVIKSLDPGLDANAITAVSNWRFKPGMKDGKAVTVLATIEVTFHLY